MLGATRPETDVKFVVDNDVDVAPADDAEQEITDEAEEDGFFCC